MKPQSKGGMILMMLLVLTVFSTMLFGCGEENNKKSTTPNSETNNDTTGDKLYVPKEYKQILKTKNLTEIVALPYFKSPFISIAKNTTGDQFAVIFRDSGQTEVAKLPIKYEGIVKTIESKGFNINSSTSSLKNLHLFEINKKLVWNYEEGSMKIYLDLDGKEVNPF
jgi:hypothetical protein